jgi:hypothetical protein
MRRDTDHVILLMPVSGVSWCMELSWKIFFLRKGKSKNHGVSFNIPIPEPDSGLQHVTKDSGIVALYANTAAWSSRAMKALKSSQHRL